jgi:hypothetical protein
MYKAVAVATQVTSTFQESVNHTISRQPERSLFMIRSSILHPLRIFAYGTAWLVLNALNVPPPSANGLLEYSAKAGCLLDHQPSKDKMPRTDPNCVAFLKLTSEIR